jgi:hypothetical protein
MITQNGRSLATDQSWKRRIDRTVSELPGTRFTRVRIGPKMRPPAFDKDLELTVRPIARIRRSTDCLVQDRPRRVGMQLVEGLCDSEGPKSKWIMLPSERYARPTDRPRSSRSRRRRSITRLYLAGIGHHSQSADQLQQGRRRDNGQSHDEGQYADDNRRQSNEPLPSA